MKFILFSFCFIILNTMAFARGGDEKGNGGHFLLCQSETSPKPELILLDFYEAEAEYKLKLDFPNNVLWPELLNRKLDELERLSPLRARHYREVITEMLKNIEFVPNGRLLSSDDTGPISIPDQCKLVQIATQIRDPETLKRKFYVDKDLWGSLPDVQKAGLVLHEVILTEAVDSLHTHSKRARWLNGFIWSDQLALQSVTSLRALIQNRAQFRYIDNQNFWIELYDSSGVSRNNEPWPNSNVWRYIYTKPDSQICNGQTCWISSEAPDRKSDLAFDRNGNIVSAFSSSGQARIDNQNIRFDGWVGFHANQKIKSVNLKNSVWELRRTKDAVVLSNSLYFNENGTLQSALIFGRQSVAIASGQKPVFVGYSDDRVSVTYDFHENGTFASAFLSQKALFAVVNGKKVEVDPGYYRFTKDGEIILK